VALGVLPDLRPSESLSWSIQTELEQSHGLVRATAQVQNGNIGEGRKSLFRFPCQMAKELTSNAKENNRSAPARFEFVLPADVHAISPVVGWVMRLVSELEYAAGKEFEIELALREALANAIMHGCKADPAKKIECTVTGDKNRGILVVVRDPGPGFDVASLPSPTEGQNLHADHGRGVYLINKLMDEVKYERNGSEIHMRKY
jgi:serine/threonine-protein kinase RsbW